MQIVNDIIYTNILTIHMYDHKWEAEWRQLLTLFTIGHLVILEVEKALKLSTYQMKKILETVQNTS